MKPQLITAERLAAEAAQAWHRATDVDPEVRWIGALWAMGAL